MSSLRRGGLCLILVLVLSMQSGAARASGLGQDGNVELTFGEPVTGVLNDESFRRVYVLRVRADDRLTITLEWAAGDLDPLLLLMNQHGAIVAASDDDGPGRNARIAGWQALEGGRYFVVASRFGQEHGSSSGTYNLLAVREEVAVTNAPTLTIGGTQLGRITPQAPVSFYFLQAQRGEVLDLTMRRTSGSLDPQLDLVTPDGHTLAQNDDDPASQGTLDAAIRDFTVLEDGVYVVVATRFGREAGSTEGSFVLSAAAVGPDRLGATADRARLIDPGDALQGALDDSITARYYWFEGRRGDVVTITLSAEGGTLDPYVRLLDAAFVELAANDNSGVRGQAQILAYTLPESGRYHIVATRSGEQAGTTSGMFTLRLEARPGVIGTHALELVYGAAATGSISAEQLAEAYVFFGNKGDIITLTMERTSGDLDPLLTLQDSAGKSIAFDDDSAGNQNARLERFTLPHDDMYTVVASRFDGEAGTTSGTYLLSLDLVRPGR